VQQVKKYSRALLQFHSRHSRLHFLKLVVEEAGAVGQPTDTEEACARDWLVDLVSGGHVEHTAFSSFGTSGSNANHDIFPVPGRLKSAQTEMSCLRSVGHGVYQETLWSCEGVAHVEPGNEVSPVPLLIEEPLPSYGKVLELRRRGIGVFFNISQQCGAARDGIENSACISGLPFDPRLNLRVLGIFHVSVRVVDRRAEVGIGDRPDGSDRRGILSAGEGYRGKQERTKQQNSDRSRCHMRDLSSESGKIVKPI
jgi:hypothetical protein